MKTVPITLFEVLLQKNAVRLVHQDESNKLLLPLSPKLTRLSVSCLYYT